jgi:hypothetical protein
MRVIGCTVCESLGNSTQGSTRESDVVYISLPPWSRSLAERPAIPSSFACTDNLSPRDVQFHFAQMIRGCIPANRSWISVLLYRNHSATCRDESLLVTLATVFACPGSTAITPEPRWLVRWRPMFPWPVKSPVRTMPRLLARPRSPARTGCE